MTIEGIQEPSEELRSTLDAAAQALREADALLIGAGAGMGVDSGLPDFRGDEGFWKAYPPFQGRRFAEISNPYWFRADPAQAWGFFGHRLNLYSEREPHAGFHILRSWQEHFARGIFVFTSNVDGHFQRAGFAQTQVLEYHGSIHFMQCVRPCGHEVWPVDDLRVSVDAATIRATSRLPTCPHCKGLARPNILMFEDADWISARAEEQETHYREWLHRTRDSKRVALEFGAGMAVPTVRNECERRSSTLIRVNPREARTRTGNLSLPMTALQAIEALDARLRRDG